ncbi:glycosyltransferase involved in cell wall biosynthesis [Luteibacter sp. Sphag1AF]|uniref:glycosyltransferase n=1 Tax=Luteibacter sp. Sphag1AF TaxID=2587031 RepID=UPI00160FBD68|nr:glycosyltransferase [Luteibacter sp. Sphag1AF]MBB3225847.1 glycosyltransferase involved in cell wall biosynthesis [Luteibacter sp. Sphag1AF]
MQRMLQERSRARAGNGSAQSWADIVVAAPPVQTAPRRILIVDSMTPDATRDSGSMRLTQIFALLHADGWTIDFFPDDGLATRDDAVRLAAMGVRISREALASWLPAHGPKLQAVMLCRLPVADQYLDITRRLAPHARVLFDTVDLHFVRERRAAALTGSRSLARQAARSRTRELHAIHRSDVTLVVSDDERAVLARELPDARVVLLSNVHDIHDRGMPFEQRKDLLFVGGFGHPPNADAVHWFASEILPRLRQHEPDIQLHVVGDIDDASRQALSRDGLVIHGRVPDLTPLLENVRLSVAPLRFGAGVKGKVNQAMSHGLPVVATGIAAEGMYLVHGENAMIADAPADFASAVLAAYTDADLWLKLSDAAMENVREHFSVEGARRSLQRALSGDHA